MHHQPTRTFIPSADTIGLADRVAFEALVRRFRKKIAHIFFGHRHLLISGSLCGVGFTGLPATAPQQYPNFASQRFVPDPKAPPAYGVVFTEEATISTHVVWVEL